MPANDLVPHALVSYVAAIHNVPTTAVLSRSRKQEYFLPRAISCYLLAKRGYGAAAIGRMLGRDHSTVSHAIAYVQDRPALLRNAATCEELLMAREAYQVTRRRAQCKERMVRKWRRVGQRREEVA